MSVLLSFGLAAAAAVAAEKLDTSFHAVDELVALTRAPIAATIPWIVTSADGPRRRRRFAAGILGAAFILALVMAGSWFLAHGNENLVRVVARSR